MSPASRIPEHHLVASFPRLTLPAGGPPAAARHALCSDTGRIPSRPTRPSLPPGVGYSLGVCVQQASAALLGCGGPGPPF